MQFGSKSKLYLIGNALAFTFLSGACVNMSTLQTAETLKQNDSRTIIGAGYYTSPSVNKQLKDASKDTNNDFEDLKVPYAEVGYRYGISDDFELGGKLTLIGTIAVDGKYHLLNHGAFDLAIGGGVGYVSLESSAGSGDDEAKAKDTIIDLLLPLYASYRFAPAFALYTSPKYVYRHISSKTTDAGETKNDSSGVSMAGGTVGMMIGSSWGLALEGTYMKAIGTDFSMMQIASGIFF